MQEPHTMDAPIVWLCLNAFPTLPSAHTKQKLKHLPVNVEHLSFAHVTMVGFCF